MEKKMLRQILTLAFAGALVTGTAVPAMAGAVKGAAGGAVAGHMLGHHAKAGAAVGAVAGHHHAKKKAGKRR